MRKTLLTLVLLTLVSGPILAGGSGSSTQPLAGSYPIVLAHGILGFDDTSGLAGGLVKYWGGIDDYLRSQGVPVLTPGMQAMNDNVVRGNQLKNQVNYWMAANGYTKVHIIGHSQGGLTARYMTSNLGMSSKVRSITSLNSVHRGTPVADIGLAVIPSWLQPSVALVLNAFGAIIYGKTQQDIIAMAKSLTTGAMSSFNNTVPNVSTVKYFSYGSKMTIADPFQHPVMVLTYPICWTGGVFNGQGGDNDGVVPVSSQKWGTWMGGPSYGLLTTGVDHLEATNLEWWGQKFYDVQGYFLKMAQNAKANQ
ncbi:MAG: alpha/beta fold hydrolase [Spirochaetia bacterium]|nr:alpha/beta fold hydrolase [Spirochaetia bacterium]